MDLDLIYHMKKIQIANELSNSGLTLTLIRAMLNDFIVDVDKQLNTKIENLLTSERVEENEDNQTSDGQESDD